MSSASTEKKVEAFPPGKLGEYKVINEIAEGTFGKVKSPSPLFAVPHLYLI